MLNVTRLLRAYARRRESHLARSPRDVQREQLTALLHAASSTTFGKDHGFADILSARHRNRDAIVADYQRRVPLRRYEDFWREYWEHRFPTLTDCSWPGTIPFFAVTSGTTSGRTKYIPVTHQMVRSNTKAGLDLLIHHLLNRPHSQLLGGRSFMLGGSTELVERAPGIFSGDLSGIAAKTMPWWAQLYYFPPAKLALLADWEKKIDILARESLDANIRMISGVPSWMLIFIKRLYDISPQAQGALGKIYPELEMVVHGGVNFAPYRKQFEDILASTHAELREVYPASEGFIGVGDRRSGDGMRVILDHGIFFEFIPLSELESAQPIRHWIGEVQRDVEYAIALTTCAGLWSYVLGDTVRFVETDPPRLVVTGRTSYFLSAFGEHLAAEEVEDAVTSAAAEIGCDIRDYAIGAVYPEKPSDLGGHRCFVELEQGDPGEANLAKFAHRLDARLKERNEDYEAHRASGFGLNAPQVSFVTGGTFAEWMRSRGKLGGQHKVPRIISDTSLFSDLNQFALNRIIRKS